MRVKAKNPAGASAFSSPARVGGCRAVPAPEGPESVSVSCSARLVVDVSWDADPDASGYSATSTGGLAPYSDSDTGFTRRGETGVQYAVTVRSIIDGITSKPSQASAVCPETAAIDAVWGDVTGVSLSCGADGWVRASWDAAVLPSDASFVSYEVGGGFTDDIRSRTAPSAGWEASSGATYKVRVKTWANDLSVLPMQTRQSTWSDYARTTCPVLVPTGVSVKCDNHSVVTIDWDEVRGASEYELEGPITHDEPITNSELKWQGVQAQTYSDIAVRAKAAATGVWSDWSKPELSITCPTRPAGPANVTAVCGHVPDTSDPLSASSATVSDQLGLAPDVRIGGGGIVGAYHYEIDGDLSGLTAGDPVSISARDWSIALQGQWGRTHTIRARADLDDGPTAWSDDITFTCPPLDAHKWWGAAHEIYGLYFPVDDGTAARGRGATVLNNDCGRTAIELAYRPCNEWVEYTELSVADGWHKHPDKDTTHQHHHIHQDNDGVHVHSNNTVHTHDHEHSTDEQGNITSHEHVQASGLSTGEQVFWGAVGGIAGVGITALLAPSTGGGSIGASHYIIGGLVGAGTTLGVTLFGSNDRIVARLSPLSSPEIPGCLQDAGWVAAKATVTTTSGTSGNPVTIDHVINYCTRVSKSA